MLTALSVKDKSTQAQRGDRLILSRHFFALLKDHNLKILTVLRYHFFFYFRGSSLPECERMRWAPQAWLMESRAITRSNMICTLSLFSPTHPPLLFRDEDKQENPVAKEKDYTYGHENRDINLEKLCTLLDLCVSHKLGKREASM